MTLLLDLAKDLGLSVSDINLIAKTAHHRYKEFHIPKKSGDFRLIAQPAKEVKLLQRWVIANVISKLPIHESSTAYMYGKNIKFNALQHANNPFLLKMDFTNFFPSIVPRDFKLHVQRHLPEVYTLEEIELLCCILFWKKKGESKLQLSIGGPSSPSLSNSIMYDFDLEMTQECKLLNVAYTRYADDITFSSNNFDDLRVIQDKVFSKLQKITYPKLSVNKDKTVFLSKKGNRTVTGLTLNNQGEVSLGRDKKRNISCQIHRFKTNKLDHDSILKLRGMLCFASDVEPLFLDRMRNKYTSITISEIFRYNTFQ